MPTIPAPVLPAGSVSTAYERMITFGVEYGPYTRLAAAFRDLILGRPSDGPTPATFADGVAMMDRSRRRPTVGGGRRRLDGDRFLRPGSARPPLKAPVDRRSSIVDRRSSIVDLCRR